MNELRKKIANLARSLYAKEITFDEFLHEVPDQDHDDLIDELVDLIEHEPKKGGLLGVSDEEHEKYVNNIFGIIKQLEKDTS